MSLTQEEEKQIFKFLRGTGCCLKCCLRFLGLKPQECYEKPSEYIKRYEYVSNGNDFPAIEMVCVACLGILQETMEEEIVQKVETTVREEGFDCETFTSGLMLPLCISLREQLLQTKCAKELDLSKDKLCALKMKLQSVKDIWKMVTVPKLEKAIKKCSELVGASPFLIEVILSYSNDEKECKALLETSKVTNNASAKRKRKHNDNKFTGKFIEELMAEKSDEEFFELCNKQIIEDTCTADIAKVNCSHTSIFIGGRYAKLSRQLSQTPWFINGEKRMETSVQDLLCDPIANAVKSRIFKFLSSGREDVDVRNINAGRPFAIELINPRMTKITPDLLSDLVHQINKSTKQVQITSHLKVLSRADLKNLKDGENVKTKIYRALCVCRNANKDTVNLDRISNLKHLKIVQKTPLRVLHRRPLSPRTRCIYDIRVRWAKPQELGKLLNTAEEQADMFFVLDMKTQAGTYVKEFVHGDFGRTKPSLCDLLNTEVDIVALDVTGINLDWP